MKNSRCIKSNINPRIEYFDKKVSFLKLCCVSQSVDFNTMQENQQEYSGQDLSLCIFCISVIMSNYMTDHLYS